MDEDLKKLDPAQRYIHSIKTTPTGAKLIFTADTFLLGLIHHAVSIQVDTTFKRAIGELKEWEVVMWERRVKRSKSSVSRPMLRFTYSEKNFSNNDSACVFKGIGYCPV